MPFPLLAVLGGLLSAGGTIYTNQQQKKMAREQMAFQERMSSTAAQRSKEDYQKAGLNPALAYERTASSPGGAMATLDDPINKGVSTAKDVAALAKQLQLQERETNSRVALNAASQESLRTEAALNHARTISENINRNWAISQQPWMMRLNAANALTAEAGQVLTEYQLPGARNTAAFESGIGQLGKTAGIFGGSAKTLAEIFKLLSGSKINPVQVWKR